MVSSMNAHDRPCCTPRSAGQHNCRAHPDVNGRLLPRAARIEASCWSELRACRRQPRKYAGTCSVLTPCTHVSGDPRGLRGSGGRRARGRIAGSTTASRWPPSGRPVVDAVVALVATETGTRPAARAWTNPPSLRCGSESRPCFSEFWCVVDHPARGSLAHYTDGTRRPAVHGAPLRWPRSSRCCPASHFDPPAYAAAPGTDARVCAGNGFPAVVPAAHRCADRPRARLPACGRAATGRGGRVGGDRALVLVPVIWLALHRTALADARRVRGGFCRWCSSPRYPPGGGAPGTGMRPQSAPSDALLYAAKRGGRDRTAAPELHMV
jgi:hypothetical protein